MRTFVCLVLLLAASTPASAHHLEYTLAIVDFDRDSVDVSLQFHVAAFVLGEEPGLLSQPALRRARAVSDEELQSLIDAARQRLEQEILFEFDGTPWRSAEFAFPTVQQIRDEALATEPAVSPPVTIHGPLLEKADTFTAEFPARLGKVMLNLQGNGVPTNVQVLRPGERSWPYLVREELSGGTIRIPAWMQVGWAYLVLGFEHIVPKGLDHILFVLGLFLLNQHWRPLLAQVTAFTIAHSVTLALSMFGIFSLPSSIVEPLIALSIAYVAIENIFTEDLKFWRPIVVFAFGLLHGLGFVDVLRELGVPGEHSIIALVTFNVGVELGQLAVIAMALLSLGWFRDRKWYRQGIVIPLSSIIAFVGVYWTVQRVLGG